MAESNDELIARLKRESGGSGQPHDPFLDIPGAEDVHVTPEEVPASDGVRCPAVGRRALQVPSLTSYPATVEIQCELPPGHPGGHRARFERSRFRHRWSALEWPRDGAES